MNRLAFLMLCLAAGCQRTSQAQPAPAPTPAPVEVAKNDPAPEAVTGASQKTDPADDNGSKKPTVNNDARTIEVKQPLRGLDNAKAPVFVAKGGDPAALVERALKALDPKIPADARVIIKVNLGGFDSMHPGKPDDGVTGRITNPETVRAIVLALRAHGAKDIALADGQSSPQGDMDKLLKLSGYAALAAELKVPFLDLNHYGDKDPRPRPWHMKLPWAKALKNGELVLSNDLVDPKQKIYLVDVPKLKMHRFAVMSESIKNLMGTVNMFDSDASMQPFERRYRMHRELTPWLKDFSKSKTDDRDAYKKSLATFSERLADLYGTITPNLVIIEGTPAMQGDGFAKVIPFDDNVIIASENGCYADYVGAEYMGVADSDGLEKEIGWRMPPAIQAVAERYYGGVPTLKALDVRGDVDWLKGKRQAWFKAMAPFELGTRP